MRELLRPIIDEAIANRVTPGAVVLVSEGGATLSHEAFGRLFEAGPAVEKNTIYDCASVTKAAVTSALFMTLVDEKAIALRTKIAPLLPQLGAGPGKADIELRHLLGHGSGLPAHLHFFERIWSGDLAGESSPWDALVHMAGAEPLQDTAAALGDSPDSGTNKQPGGSAVGRQSVYSDLGYILLARLIESLTGQRLHQAFTERIANSLGLGDSQFVDLEGSAHPCPERVAPTGLGPTGNRVYPGQRAMIHAQVHDDNARSGGGISGHAGLFSTASDLARYGHELIRAYQGESAVFSSQVVRQFWNTSAAPGTTWRMGFDTPSPIPGVSHTGDHWPATGVGHLGFTGTSMWLAPEQSRLVVILSNRTYYSWEPAGIKALRRKLTHAIGQALSWHNKKSAGTS